MPITFIEDKSKCISVTLDQLDQYFLNDDTIYISFDLPYKDIKEEVLNRVRLSPYKEVYLYVNREEIVAYHIETAEMPIPEKLLDPHSTGPKRRIKKKEKIDIRERIRMTYTSNFPYLANVNKKKIDGYLEGTYVLDKYELLSICIALKMEIDDVENVLFFEGYGFNKMVYKDRLIRALIEQHRYDIFTVLESVFATNKR